MLARGLRSACYCGCIDCRQSSAYCLGAKILAANGSATRLSSVVVLVHDSSPAARETPLAALDWHLVGNRHCAHRHLAHRRRAMGAFSAADRSRLTTCRYSRTPVAAAYFASAIALSITILTHYLVAAFERSRLAEKQALQSQVLAREAELKSLRSQLDPHFLFNALNSVAALIGNDTAAARRMCYLMAGFFRKSVALGKKNPFPLPEEMQLIETFLAIEEVRFGDRLRKKFDIAKIRITCRCHRSYCSRW